MSRCAQPVPHASTATRRARTDNCCARAGGATNLPRPPSEETHAQADDPRRVQADGRCEPSEKGKCNRLWQLRQEDDDSDQKLRPAERTTIGHGWGRMLVAHAWAMSRARRTGRVAKCVSHRKPTRPSPQKADRDQLATKSARRSDLALVCGLVCGAHLNADVRDALHRGHLRPADRRVHADHVLFLRAFVSRQLRLQGGHSPIITRRRRLMHFDDGHRASTFLFPKFSLHAVSPSVRGRVPSCRPSRCSARQPATAAAARSASRTHLSSHLHSGRRCTRRAAPAAATHLARRAHPRHSCLAARQQRPRLGRPAAATSTTIRQLQAR